MDFIYQNILLIALVVVSGVALILPMLMGSGANDVNPAAATLLINREDAQVIDVREADEFAAGHLPEAKNVPLAKLADRISEIERFKDKPVIVCCASGMRSGKACGELRKLGFAKIHNLSGGIDAWVGAGYPVKKGTRNR
ncbi:MAG TPA: rhodanese-like domain-containing protein [Azonexus sp.]|jgi:rhodanese-related sulfurtransferase|nr:rhodanese-like domain-containing protein [Azonexus sp.]